MVPRHAGVRGARRSCPAHGCSLPIRLPGAEGVATVGLLQCASVSLPGGSWENLHKFYDPLTYLLRRLYEFSARIAHTLTFLEKNSVVSPVWVGSLAPAGQALTGLSTVHWKRPGIGMVSPGGASRGDRVKCCRPVGRDLRGTGRGTCGADEGGHEWATRAPRDSGRLHPDVRCSGSRL